MTFTETYLKFNKATTFMQENPAKREANHAHFNELCDQLDHLWRKSTRTERTAWASELVGSGVNNLVFHYELYGSFKRTLHN